MFSFHVFSTLFSLAFFHSIPNPKHKSFTHAFDQHTKRKTRIECSDWIGSCLHGFCLNYAWFLDKTNWKFIVLCLSVCACVRANRADGNDQKMLRLYRYGPNFESWIFCSFINKCMLKPFLNRSDFEEWILFGNWFMRICMLRFCLFWYSMSGLSGILRMILSTMVLCSILSMLISGGVLSISTILSTILSMILRT